MAPQKRVPDEKTGWRLVGLAVVLMIAWAAAIPFIRHSGFVFGLWRGLGFAPAAAGASGANIIAAAARREKPPKIPKPLKATAKERPELVSQVEAAVRHSGSGVIAAKRQRPG
jgi:hypothetical protein